MGDGFFESRLIGGRRILLVGSVRCSGSLFGFDRGEAGDPNEALREFGREFVENVGPRGALGGGQKKGGNLGVEGFFLLQARIDPSGGSLEGFRLCNFRGRCFLEKSGSARGVEPPQDGNGDEQGGGEGEVWNPPRHDLCLDNRRGREGDFHRAISEAAQGASDKLPEPVGTGRRLFGESSFGDDDIFERVEKLHSRLEFLDEKFRDIAQRSAPAAEKNTKRRRAAMRGAVEIHRPRNLGVEACHRVANDFREAGLDGVFGIGISATEADEAFFDLQFLGQRDVLLELLGDRRADGMSANGNAATKRATIFRKNQIRRPSAEIDKKGALFHLGVIVSKGVVESHRRHIHIPRPEPTARRRIQHLGELLGLDRHEGDIPRLVAAVAHDLVVPDDLLDGKRNILLRFEADDGFDILGRRAGQFQETRKNRLRWQTGENGCAGLGFQRLAEFLRHRLDLQWSRRIGRGIQNQLGLRESQQLESTSRQNLELRQTDGLHSEIEAEDAFGSGHGSLGEKLRGPTWASRAGSSPKTNQQKACRSWPARGR